MELVIGLTGGIASGKSTVANMLKEFNLPVIDADRIAREVVEPGKEAYKKIIEMFGSEVISSNGTINRKKLGNTIFNDEEKRLQLNNIVHPAVRQSMHEQKERYINEGNHTVILDIPLLFESNLTHMVNKIILVYVDEEIQLTRLMGRNQLSMDEALSRIQSQMPLREKIPLADAVLHNNGTIAETRKQLEDLLLSWEIIKSV